MYNSQSAGGSGPIQLPGGPYLNQKKYTVKGFRTTFFNKNFTHFRQPLL